MFEHEFIINTIATQLNFPEGPAFTSDGSLWVVELKGGNLVQYKDGKLQRFHVGGAPNGIAIDENGHICFCDSKEMAVRKFNPVTQQTKILAGYINDQKLNKPNDLAFDNRSNIVFTCPGESRKEPSGYVCVQMKNGSIKKITTNKYFPNGLAFTADGKNLIIAETYKHRIWKGQWDSTNGEWINEKVWCDIGGPDGPGGPDGMAFDNAGNLFVAVYGTGKIKIVNPMGELIKEIPLPGKNPTNCAFDFRGNLGLVVTEAERGELLSIAINKMETS